MGDVDSMFCRYYSPRSNCSANELADKIKSFCAEVEREVTEIESYSKLPEIDYVNVCKTARSIKARSIVLGTKNLRSHCEFVLEAGLIFDKETLSDAVVGLRSRFGRIKSQFETYLEMHDAIVEKEKQLEEPKK
ncbi:uncharacterized protein LOC143602180 isoform X2 [Bidens hawaiensis]|uniref:uncharacterized protein LOC143602180 isoform X2 n=1 Tax=Bidens hawaiensis TaxID=980011 RepID=UPI00404B4A4B